MNRIQDHIDSITRRAATQAGVDPDGDARQELASHLYDLAAARAAGRQLTRDDIDAAWSDLAPQAVYLLQEVPAPAYVTTDAAAGPTQNRSASWLRRLGAYLADALIVIGSFFVVALTVFEAFHFPEETATASILLVLTTLFLVMVMMEVRRGGTPGKFMFQLRTVDREGHAPSIMRAAIITLPKFFPPLLAVDGILGILTGPRDRVRLTERLAQIRVVKVM